VAQKPVSAGLVCLGQITGAIGVRGEVRVRSFTARPADIAAYGPLTGEPGGQRLELTAGRPVKGGVAARVKGVTDRDAALALKGVRLYVPRGALPEPDEDEAYYYVDLIGLKVEDEAGALVGEIKAVHNFGAGEVLEISPAQDGQTTIKGGKTVMVPFTRQAVPQVDVKGGRLVIDRALAGMEQEEKKEPTER
jgi:16S rRNA processing protein RimM